MLKSNTGAFIDSNHFILCLKTLLLLLISSLYFTLNAQQSLGGEPFSFSQSTLFEDIAIPSLTIEKPNLDKLQTQDIQSEKDGKPLRYAVFQSVQWGLNNTGEWTTLPNGDRVWRLEINAPDAKAIHLLYNDFYLPTSARFFIYNKERTEVLGAFSDLNNKQDGLFATGNVPGTTSILEYYEPAAVAGQGRIAISKVGYVYRYTTHPAAKMSDPCEVDVNCSPEGDNWKNQKRGVVRISIVTGEGSFWCSGSLINNTNKDCKPYILTALHCGLGSNASHFNQYIFYFNYESSGCGVDDAPTNQSITGCTKRADSGDDGGNQGSDYLLVELNSSIPDAYNVYYNGWNANNTPSSSGVSIHHPAGDRKKISTYSTALTSTTWDNVPNTHWGVTWVQSANGHGVTEGGSSGSPIFDNTGKIIGQLTGGGSYCTSPTVSDAYGKMSYNWASNPGDPLKTWLDPTNSGVLELAGSKDPCANGGGGGGGTPTCSDGVQNGDETGVDCGGSNCSPCETAGCDNMQLIINPDDYSEETTWEVKLGNTVVKSGGPYNTTSQIIENICLPENCYDFVIYDESEDGICCGQFGNGSYELKRADGTMVAQGGEFGASQTTNFCTKSSTALPLEWLSFTANADQQGVKLAWWTASESENAGFHVLRSADGEQWENLTWIAAATNHRSQQSYQFTDTQPLNGRSYYQLQQVDNSRKYNYSEVRLVDIELTETAVSIYPNPLRQDVLELVLPQADILTQVMINDQLGRQIWTEELTATQVNLAHLPAGIYWLTITQGAQRWTERLVRM